ncbi:sugar ABC transporter ATP-binding protein [Dictyobacter arantiisoli]|uniref:Ribose import ATP-binding protein RbsA n=1 Tax=Dictyobacter arantiisoli TaxID=2014874 RepID=A0A5A5TF19_9CHLR|nr:sugar ABC transporter ATP-binding protein [Dictyobacter arantiisoli]GCF10012.1 ribose import ATP-binding protein RbsA [Dictyobacter arantiisoli]
MDESSKESLPEHRVPGNVNLRMEHISKRFPGVKALQDMHLEIREGEIHALVGENGAGKSTLMKILAGVYRPDSGTIELSGKSVVIDNPNKARALGISIIHQELNLSPNLTVAENIFMGREPHSPLGWIDFRHMNQETQEVLAQIGATFSPSTRVGRLSIAQQQLVEISRALSENARIVVMDEPTASLTGRETKKLFDIMRTLKSRGITIIYISHRMAEIYELADRATVLRDGQYVTTMERADITDSKLIQSMVGREINELYEHAAVKIGDTVLEVRNLSDREYIQGTNLLLRRGEIVGLAGLIGAGRTELARLIFGADRHISGEIRVDGKSVTIHSTIDAIRAGIGLVPESRKEQGLFLELAVQENIAMNTLSKMTTGGLLNMGRIHHIAQEQVDNLGIRLASLKQKVLNLSGGNQQKVVLARWLTIKPKILLLDEPTRGVDVGAKAEIYRIMSKLAHSGVAILMISSELPEVLGMSDRILVMHEGRIAAELPGRTTTQEEIMTHAAGLAVH